MGKPAEGESTPHYKKKMFYEIGLLKHIFRITAF
jgi:hypothetical protein